MSSVHNAIRKPRECISHNFPRWRRSDDEDETMGDAGLKKCKEKELKEEVEREEEEEEEEDEEEEEEEVKMIRGG